MTALPSTPSLQPVCCRTRTCEHNCPYSNHFSWRGQGIFGDRNSGPWTLQSCRVCAQVQEYPRFLLHVCTLCFSYSLRILPRVQIWKLCEKHSILNAEGIHFTKLDRCRTYWQVPSTYGSVSAVSNPVMTEHVLRRSESDSESLLEWLDKCFEWCTESAATNVITD